MVKFKKENRLRRKQHNRSYERGGNRVLMPCPTQRLPLLSGSPLVALKVATLAHLLAAVKRKAATRVLSPLNGLIPATIPTEA